MNEQYFEPSNISLRELIKTMNNPAVNPDPFAEKVPVDAALIQETPMGGD